MDCLIHIGIEFLAYKDKEFPSHRKIFKWQHIAPLIITLISSSLSRISIYNSQNEQERLNMELKFLKSQINPHFLFNSLNNIYTLTLLKSDDAATNLMKLSKILRYVVYDCADERVRLVQEAEYIKNYLDLMQLKDSKGLNITADLTVSEATLQVAPMIFMTFLENAFKHSEIENVDNGWIKIELKTVQRKIYFQISNSVFKENLNDNGTRGIGLNNIQKQLEILYPGKHQLEIKRGENSFSVNLEIHTS